MRTLYYAYFHSHINYGLSIWGSMCYKRDLNRVKIQQKKAVRTVGNAKFNAHTDPLFKKYNILKIDDLFNTGTDFHQYNTRNKNNPVVAKHKSSVYNKSFLCRCPSLFTNLTDDLKNCKTIKSFTKKYRKKENC